MDNLSQYTEKEYQQIFQRKVSQITRNISVNEKPQAFILGGQAGAGKSSLHKVIKEEMQGNVIVIDNDTFKPLHPNYNELAEKIGIGVTEQVRPFSDRLTEDLIEYLSDKKYNLVVEGTLRTAETPLKTNKQLKDKGYTINLYVIATEKELSYLSTLERYVDMFMLDPKTARATPKGIHDEIVEKIADNLDSIYKRGVFDNIRVLTREGDTLYSMQETPLESPKDRLQQKIDTSLTEENKERIINRLSDKLETIQQLSPAENETLTAINDKIKEFKTSIQTPNATKKTALQLEIEQPKKIQQELLNNVTDNFPKKSIDKGKQL